MPDTNPPVWAMRAMRKVARHTDVHDDDCDVYTRIFKRNDVCLCAKERANIIAAEFDKTGLAEAVRRDLDEGGEISDPNQYLKSKVREALTRAMEVEDE